MNNWPVESRAYHFIDVEARHARNSSSQLFREDIELL
jgi:hypothetical protein